MKRITQSEFAVSSEVDRPLRRAMLNNVRLRKPSSPRYGAPRGLPDPPRTARWISQRRILSKLLLSILGAWCVRTSDAVTLETVFQTTLEKNPAIQEAKSNLEQAAGQRLVLRSVIWPIVTMAVPAGVQAATERARVESRALPWRVASSRRPCLTQPCHQRSGAETSTF